LHPPIEVDAAITFWTRTLPDGGVKARHEATPVSLFSITTVLQTSGRSRVKAVRKNGKDDYDKLSLPTNSSFIEDILEMRARRFITDAEFGRSGPKCLSCDEMKC
jgi:hypothetical protein